VCCASLLIGSWNQGFASLKLNTSTQTAFTLTHNSLHILFGPYTNLIKNKYTNTFYPNKAETKHKFLNNVSVPTVQTLSWTSQLAAVYPQLASMNAPSTTICVTLTIRPNSNSQAHTQIPNHIYTHTHTSKLWCLL